MHRVERIEDLAEALVTARREAAGAFGDDSLFIEHFVDTPRHIEVQVLADSHGNVIHLGERECSLQRRHQKVIEEAPSPLLDETVRARIGQAACDAARSCGYVGAGTVEFIVPAADPDKFYFMEMNTRLQVEHPVTEEVTGLDLVALQLAIARGCELPISQDQVTMTGHSIEARVYAEDPAAGFLPTGGTVTRVVEPAGPGVRVDSGIADGSEVTSLYDPMLLKVIVHGADRAEALDRLDRALANTVVAGVGVNVDFCRYLLSVPEVASGDLDTGLLDRVAADFTDFPVPDEALVAAAMAWLAGRWPDGPASPWAVPDAWRSGRAGTQRLRLRTTNGSSLLAISGTPTGATVTVDARVAGISEPAEGEDVREPREYSSAIHRDGDLWRVDCDGIARHWQVETVAGRNGIDVIVSSDEGTWVLHRENVVRSAADDDGAGDGTLTSPMPGTVIALSAAEGDRVEAGAPVLVVEAMKMEHTLRAPTAGVVEYHVTAGAQVSTEVHLATVVPDED